MARSVSTCSGSKWLFTRTSVPTLAAISATIEPSVSSESDTVPANAEPYRVTPYGSAGRTSTGISPASRSAARSQIPTEITVSVESGACGPCGSVAPSGSRCTAPSGTSGYANSPRFTPEPPQVTDCY